MNRLKLNSIKGSLNVITGCGSGLGRSTLKWFLNNDCGPTLAIDRSYEADFLDKLEVGEDKKEKVLLKAHDTFDVQQTEDSLSEFVSKHGSIDNVINVAGVSLSFLMYTKKSEKLYDMKHAQDLLKFNTVGTFNVIRLASKYMVEDHLKTNDKTKTKCIINTSCISTTAPSLGQTFYASSKAALDSMTLCIARELSPFNIRCNTINVGYFDTKLIRASEERVVDYIRDEICLCPRRIGQPDEFAHLVQAIIENQMINGACIKIDGASKEVN